MPTVLLTVDAVDQSSAVLSRVTAQLAALDRSMQSVRSSASGMSASLSASGASYSRAVDGADRAALALARYQQASARAATTAKTVADMIASGATSTAAYARAADQATTATIRQAEAGLKLAAAYRSQAHDADVAAAAARAAASTPVGKEPTGRGAGGSGGSGGYGMGNYLLAGAGYQLAYAGIGAIKNSIGANVALSATAGQTVASTTMNPGDIAKLESYATKMASSGTQPYDAQTILTGLYQFMSQGFNVQQAEAMNNTAVGLAQVGGMPDTTASGQALLAMGNAFGWGKNMNASSRSYANYIQTGTNIGAYSPADLATALPNSGLAQLGRIGFNPQFAMTAMSAGSFSGESAEHTAQNLAALGATFTTRQPSAVRAARVMGMDLSAGGIQQAGGAEQWFQTLEKRIATLPASQQGEMLHRIFPDQAALAMASELFSGTGPRSMQSVYSQMGLGQQGKGSAATALGIEQQTPGQQLLSKEAQLSQAFNNLTTQTLPTLTKAADLAAGALAVINGKPGSNPLENIGGYIDKLTVGFQLVDKHFSSPGDPGFLNLGVAKREAGQDVVNQQYAAAAAAAVGLGTGAMNRVGTGIPKMTPWYGGQWQGGAGPGGVQVAPGATGRADYSTLGRGGGAPGNYGGPNYASAANAYLGTSGRSTTTADMTRFENNLKIAIAQGQPASVVQSALGLAIQAIKGDPALSGSQKTLDILNETKLAAKYTGNITNSTKQPFNNPNVGIGDLVAGAGNTAVRFGGGQDPQLAEIAKLRAEVARDNDIIQKLLQQIATNTGTQRANTAKTSPLVGTGTNRMAVR